MEKTPNPADSKFVSYEEYDRQGDQYVAAQREFYSALPDTGRKFFQAVIKENVQNKTIVDIGCGAGDDLITYTNMGASRVIGVEPSVVMLNAANTTLKEKNVRAELIQGLWHRIPLPDASVDAVTSRYSFHIIPDFREAFREVTRILKTDGHFLIAVPHPKYDRKLVEEQEVHPGQTIKSSLFEGKVTVENYPHFIEDYIGDVALEYFALQKMVEYSMNEKEDETEPTALLIDYRKK